MPRESIPPIWPYLGINIGSDISQGFPNLNSPNNITDAEKAVFFADIDYHIAIGIKYARVAGMDWKYVGGSSAGSYGQLRLAILKEMELRYLAGGVNVQHMVADSDWTLAGTASNDAFKAYLTSEAIWCQSVGIQRIQLDNELEIHMPPGATRDDAYDWQQELAQVVIDAGYTGIITTSVCQDNEMSWNARGVGLFHELGLDTYKVISGFASYIRGFKATFGDAAYLSEWGLNPADADIYIKDSHYISNDIIKRLNSIKEIFPNKPNYYFSWKYWGGEGDDARGASTEYGDIRHLWYGLINKRNPLYS